LLGRDLVHEFVVGLVQELDAAPRSLLHPRPPPAGFGAHGLEKGGGRNASKKLYIHTYIRIYVYTYIH
jgi:hypothetical protein